MGSRAQRNRAAITAGRITGRPGTTTRQVMEHNPGIKPQRFSEAELDAMLPGTELRVCRAQGYDQYYRLPYFAFVKLADGTWQGYNGHGRPVERWHGAPTYSADLLSFITIDIVIYTGREGGDTAPPLQEGLRG